MGWNFTDLVITATDDAGHSATVTCYQGDFSISGLMPDGKAPELGESQGSVCSLRKGARSYPTVSWTAFSSSTISDMVTMLMGLTTGFVSTTAGIGDYPTVDLDATWTLGAATHQAVLEDCYASYDMTDGSQVTDSPSLTCIGPVTIDGKAVISER